MFVNTDDNLNKVSNTNIKLKSGFLSAYGFACGYVERRESDVISLEMFKEHGTYHVKYNRFDLPYGHKDLSYWETYSLLNKAKADFMRCCDKLNFKRIR